MNVFENRIHAFLAIVLLFKRQKYGVHILRSNNH